MIQSPRTKMVETCRGSAPLPLETSFLQNTNFAHHERAAFVGCESTRDRLLNDRFLSLSVYRFPEDPIWRCLGSLGKTLLEFPEVEPQPLLKAHLLQIQAAFRVYCDDLAFHGKYILFSFGLVCSP